MPSNFKTLVFLILTLAVTAWAQSSSTLVGTWVNDAQHSRWIFRADGTGFMESGETKATARFDWRLQGNALQVSTASTTMPYEIVQCDNQTLVIKNKRTSKTYHLSRQATP